MKWQIVFLVLLLSSCTADVYITLENANEGSIDATVRFHPIFLDYYRDLVSITGDQLAPEEFVKIISPYADIQATRSDDWETLSIRIHSKNISSFIANLNLPASLEYSENAIDFSVYPHRGLSPSKKLQNISILSLFIYPKSDYQAYLDDVSWALEEYASIREVTDMANATYTNLYVQAPGYTPTKHSGAQVVSDTLRFHLSLNNVVEQEEPYRMTLTRSGTQKSNE